MYLRSLHLKHFRNYQDQSVQFTAAKTILIGNNAQGKSNLLEAVELLSSLKSHRTSRDRDLILDGELLSHVSGQLDKDTGSIELAMTLRQNGRRTVALNGVSLRRQLDFLGTLNMVQFSSLDLDLVRGGPDQRRQWLDSLLVQLEPVYAYVLQQYNQVLRQRNALLKAIQKEALQTPSSELALWDAQLAIAGSRVIRRRARVLNRLVPFARSWHQAISGSTEVLEIRYASNVTADEDTPEALQKAFLEKIQQRSLPEQYQGTTLVGPHRDEVDFTINQTPARQYGSQGQQRTLVLALKLAELKLIEDVIGEPPLLLLDDVLAELDLNRQNQLLEAIQDRFQTLITSTHLGSFDAQWIKSAQILEVQAGALQQEAF
ncbi:MAG: DNA replication/repair protein RecF [Myxacorys chilensis ATA2-1-KO14]|jgi:DNA replication and repair protein RecF|nr:DNA replication/repair protein RecF [Myxacorys chilensis ATA2-1-KO14]